MSYPQKEIFEAIRNFPYKPMPSDMLEVCKKDPNLAIQVALKQGSRWRESEPYILDSVSHYLTQPGDNWTLARNIIHYCKNVLLGRWNELEDSILESAQKGLNSKLIVDYCNDILKSRWAAVEPYILDPSQICDYAKSVLQQRWPEKESEILKDKNAAFNYCINVLGKRWPEFEETILADNDSIQRQGSIIRYAEFFGRWIEAEPFVNDSNYIYLYASRILNRRWPEKEKELAKDANVAFKYAEEIIRGPFPEAENTLLNSSLYFDYFSFATKSLRDLAQQLSTRFSQEMTVGEVLKIIDNGRNNEFENKLLSSTHNQGKAVWYAVNILKGRWSEAEDKILKSPKWAVVYARDVIKGRWEEAEKAISKNSKYLSQYGIEVIKGKLPVVLHNKMIAYGVQNSKNKHVVSYFEMLESQI